MFSRLVSRSTRTVGAVGSRRFFGTAGKDKNVWQRWKHSQSTSMGTIGLIGGGAVCFGMNQTFAEEEDSYMERLTKRLESLEQMLGKSGFPNTTVLDSRAITGLLSVIRDKHATHPVFVRYADRLCTILAEEGLARLNDVRSMSVETPCGRAEGLTIARYDKLCVVSVVRSGDILTDAVRKLATGCATGKILVQRDENNADKNAVFFYSKFPQDISTRQVLLCDPMLATGGSATTCIQKIVDAGVPQENIVFLTVVSCPQGILNVVKAFPKVKIITAAIDKELNHEKFIVPGLGDFGDRYYNTE
eukprot:Stramenopile-MAST_4_protein_3944